MSPLPSEENPLDRPPSKSQRKRDAVALQALGESLLTLNQSELNQLDIPESLRDALEQALKIDSHEAKRRQHQFIGKLMRTIDPEPIKCLVEQVEQRKGTEKQQLHTLEHWRERLISEVNGQKNGALTALLTEHPAIDAQQIRQLLRNHLKETQHNKPAKSFRLIYQLLAQVIT
jgi:ribosome-associated protein